MASDVDICNLSLGFLGDDAIITEIDPPDGSPQSEHCAQFYPIARDAMLQMHDWGFNTTRTTPALIGSTVTEWQYAYSLPSGCLKVLAVLCPGSTDDSNAVYFNQLTNDPYFIPSSMMPGMVSYAPQPFKVETITDKDGNDSSILYTNVLTPDLRFVKAVTDTTRFSPTFVVGCAKLLSSFLAGPIYKGETGVTMSDKMQQQFNMWFAIATGLDSNQNQEQVQHSVSWIANR